MDYLWSPWRYQYVTEIVKSAECIFCEIASQDSSLDEERYVLHRGRYNFVVLNLYPYTTGHVLVTPYAHVATLAGLDAAGMTEMMLLTQKLEEALQTSYGAEGYNLGMNLGKCAGAGVDKHVHLHFLPRWSGDTNFMSVTSETRVLPEDLRVTFQKLSPYFKP